MNRFVAVAAVLVGSLAVQVVTGATAAAHAELVSSTPSNGEMLAGAPDMVELVFSENVGEPAALVVLAADGSEVDGGELALADDTISRSYDPSAFTPGSYTASYEVTSADGHPITGTISFMVHGDAAEAAAMPSVTGTGDSTDADPLVVGLLVAAVAAALAVALVVTARLSGQVEDVPPAA
jgi:methionine-rich copper-binding protein CopC